MQLRSACAQVQRHGRRAGMGRCGGYVPHGCGSASLHQTQSVAWPTAAASLIVVLELSMIKQVNIDPLTLLRRPVKQALPGWGLYCSKMTLRMTLHLCIRRSLPASAAHRLFTSLAGRHRVKQLEVVVRCARASA